MRHEIYNYLIHRENTEISSMDETLDPTSSLDPVTCLLGISQQIRSEVHGLIAAVTTLQIRACEGLYFTIEPYYIVCKLDKKIVDKTVNDRAWTRKLWRARKRGYKESHRNALIELSKDKKEAPHQLKFWKVCIITGSFTETHYTADVDFRKGAVRVRNPIDEESSNDSNSHDWSTKKEAFSNAMRFFTEQDNFEGITVEGMSLFLDKVALELGQTIIQ